MDFLEIIDLNASKVIVYRVMSLIGKKYKWLNDNSYG